MDTNDLEDLVNKNEERMGAIIQQFNDIHSNLFDFKEFYKNDVWINLWKAFFSILNDKSLRKFHVLALNAIRILSRDKYSLEQHNLNECMITLLNMAHLTSNFSMIIEKSQIKNFSEDDIGQTEIMVEAMKCVCNLVFQNTECRRQCVRHQAVDRIIQRMLSNSLYILHSKLELFDMKLLFLLTAMEPMVRSRVIIELNGLTYITENLSEKIFEKEELTDDQIDVIIELLKVMYNILSHTEKSPSENEIQNLRLTGVLRELLFRYGELKNDKSTSLVLNCINVLMHVSSYCLRELIIKCENLNLHNNVYNTPIHIFENYNVYAIKILLNFLHRQAEEFERLRTTNDIISPVLSVLVKCVSCNRILRHYIRSVILPPLKEVNQRPEIGKELRNYLCRLQGSSDEILRDLTYELLFICCKKSARRMVKYFGYGNMAGLFCKKGILDCRRLITEFSSDSDNSDTEEYKSIQHAINPITGSYITQPPLGITDAKNNMTCTFSDNSQNMTEEEKEYHAMQLVNIIDKLQRGGLIKPCNISDDGKLKPIDHILELQETNPNNKINFNSNK